jgi:hypothetical protein
MQRELAVLIVGGYGTFGGRIVELLDGEPRLTMIVAGRSLARAQAYCGVRRNAKARLIPAAFDRAGNLAAQLAIHNPDIVVDASGPFQSYGEGRYDLIRACLEHGANYLDLADGSDFVAGVEAFDEAARKAGLFVLSGVSSFPVLTAAVVRKLASDMNHIDTIRGGIAPSPYAGVGENVIRAISGYAGQRIALRRDGKTVAAFPLTEQRPYTIAPPGHLPLLSTLFSLVDVPDLRALAGLWPQAKTIWMGAGPVPEILHRMLIALAWLVRIGVLPSLSPLARLMHAATNRLRWGEHRGGMFVEVEGTNRDGAATRRSWHLLAEGDHGPLIPSMAVAALVFGALDGRVPSPGARAAVNELELEDYGKLFASRTIYTGFRDDAAAESKGLYASLLGTAFDDLPREIREMHEISGTKIVRGRASVKRGHGIVSRLAGWMMGFPAAAEDVPVEVGFEVANGEEVWTRTFGERSFSSRQYAGRGHWDHLLCERFGPLAFAMALVLENGRLTLVLRHWRAFGVPLPLWLCPRSDAHETSVDGRFRFHVAISLPLAGLIVRYQGWLASSEQPAQISPQLRRLEP